VKYRYVSLSYARTHTNPGWLVLVRNNGLFSPFIRVSTGGVYTHAAMVIDRDTIGEIKEFVGPRITDFAFQHALYPRRVDFYSIAPEFHNLAGEYAAAEYMREMATKCNYDYAAIALIACRHIPLVRWFTSRVMQDDYPCHWEGRRFCSEAVAAAYECGLRDPVPRYPNRLVTPTDLSRSLLFRYEYTM